MPTLPTVGGWRTRVPASGCRWWSGTWSRRGFATPPPPRRYGAFLATSSSHPELVSVAYDNRPLPIGLGQSISQPYIVAYQTEVVRPREGMKILEVGTGSGYQAAVLAAAGARVFTIEIFAELAASARQRLQRLGYRATVRHGDGNEGWPEEAPFDAIVVTAAASHVPPALVEQLRPGGRMVIPVGGMYGAQNLISVEKDAAGEVRTRFLLPVAFVPMLSGLR